MSRQVYEDAYQCYRAQEMKDHDRLQRYHEFRQSNWVDISGIHKLMAVKERKYLYAVNRFSRVDLARHVFDVFQERLQLKVSGLHWVTFVPDDFLFPLDRASTFKPRELKSLIRTQMRGQDYFGMIEPSFYPHAVHPKDFRTGVVHWHAHVLAWNTNASALHLVEAQMAKEHQSFIMNEPAFHFVEANNYTTPTLLGYMLKSPINQYGYYERDLPASKLLSLGRKYHQVKGEIRTGNLAKLSLQMTDMYLDRLLMGSGEGWEILKLVRKRALRQWQSEVARRKLALRKYK